MNFRATLDMFRITRDLPVETLDVAWLLLPQCFELARIAVNTVVPGGGGLRILYALPDTLAFVTASCCFPVLFVCFIRMDLVVR